MALILEGTGNTYELGPDKEQIQQKISVSRAGEPVTGGRLGDKLVKQHYKNIHHIEECLQDPMSHWVKQLTLHYPYPPSTTPLDQLAQIAFSDLTVGAHHRGKFITATTITVPYQFSTTATIIQEVSGLVAVLVLGFYDETISPLPQNSTVAIKEPCVQINEHSGYIIRVDHPSDIAVLRGDDPAVCMMMEFATEKKEIQREGWKSQGDRAFLRGKFGSAVECYTQALNTGRQLDDLQFTQDTYRKRAFANLMFNRYQAAKEDSLASCSGISRDMKALFTAGKACYSLRSYNESKGYFHQCLQINSGDAKSQTELNRALIRLNEQENGHYDFGKMIQEQENKTWLDHADFSSRLEIKPTSYAGRGLFTTKDVEPGELLLCEKAFCLPDKYTGEEPSDTVLFNLVNGTCTQKAAHAVLFQKLVMELYKNSSSSKGFLDLDSGNYPRNWKEGSIVDGVPVVDAFLVESIRLNNCFSAPHLSRNLLKRKPSIKETHLTSGIWLKAAYINHSCVPNCGRAFIGDFLIVRALHSIPKGTEITHLYSTPDASTLFRKKVFQSNWDFECTCKLCAGENASLDENHVKRTEFAKTIKAEVMKLTTVSKPSATSIKLIEGMMRKLEGMHETSVYNNLPRLLLVHPAIWLMETYRNAKNYSKMTKYAIEVLKNFGFGNKIIDTEAGKVSLDWKGGIVNTETFNCLRNAIQEYQAMGQQKVAEECKKAARRMYIVLVGCDVGIETFLGDDM